jgi:hypothetical protein
VFYRGYSKIYDGYILILVPFLFLWGKELDFDPKPLHVAAELKI